MLTKAKFGVIHKVRVIWEAIMVVDVEAPSESAARKYVRAMAIPYDQKTDDRFDFTVRLNNDDDCDCDSCRDEDDDEDDDE